MVYLGGSIAQASMEILVHAEESPLLDQYVILAVQMPDECVLRVSAGTLPDRWDDDVMNSPAQLLGDNWLMSRASLALEVPSIAVPGGTNILLNPRHVDVGRLNVGEIESYQLDERIKRLFPENGN